MDAILSTKGLCFRQLITYPDLSIEAGCFTFVLGESGCGKSSLFRLLNATELPGAGEILYRGKPSSQLPVIEYRRRVLLVPQEVFLLDGSIRENFDFYHESRGESPPDAEGLCSLLQTCQLSLSLDSPCAVLSGGERQRVFLAIFLSFSPEVLLLDEPTAALDEKTADALFESLKKYGKGRGITLAAICHSAALAERHADRLIRLTKGAAL